MKLEHFGMAEPGDCRVVFSAAAEELEAAVQAEKAAPDAPQDEDDLLTAAVNRAILEGFSPLFAQLMKENDLQPVTDPDFELLAVNRAEGFRAIDLPKRRGRLTQMNFCLVFKTALVFSINPVLST